jgi:hypothetical protein
VVFGVSFDGYKLPNRFLFVKDYFNAVKIT